MKILIDAQSIVENRTGVGRYTLNLLLAMAQLKNPHEYIPVYFNFRRRFKEQFLWEKYSSIRPCEIRCVPGFVMHRLWRYFSFLPLDYFSGRADVVLFPNYTIEPLSSGKTVMTVHDLCFLRFPDTLMPKNLRRLKRAFEKSLSSSDAVLTVSEFSRSEFFHYYPSYQKPVVVTPNGIDEFLGFIPDEEQQKRVKLTHSLPEDFLLYVGAVEPRKNLILLLKAFSILRKKYPDLKLVMAGTKGWLSGEFHETVHQLDLKEWILFPGFISDEDLKLIYSLAKLFVFPSIYEGFGLPPLEAMACGAPVLASSIPVHREILGNAACFCSPDASPHEWAETISRIISSTETVSDMVQKGRTTAAAFTWKKTAELTLNLFEKL
ncbi:MAG: glycosyltransferase family 4 protein [Candidatus Aureabacteria bacterium]|nr:glycosyltransferase family 4 protein [Candidatus Auribacterota bacterium]